MEDAPGGVCLVVPERLEAALSRVEVRSLLDAFWTPPEGSGRVVDVVFLPDLDCETRLREQDLPVHGLRSRRPLGTFDVLLVMAAGAIQLPDLLRLLERGGVPALAAARRSEHPLVLALGELAVFPGLLLPFVDAVLTGDPEAYAADIDELVRRRDSGTREARLADLARRPGVVAGPPETAEPVPGRWLWTLPPCPAVPIVPLVETAGSGLCLEIARPLGVEYPAAPPADLRSRSLERVVREAEEALAATGEGEVMLAGGGAGRHPELALLLEALNRRLAPHEIAVRLDALDISSLAPTTARELRKGGGRLTLCPFLPSERLRRGAGRPLCALDLEERLAMAWRGGWSTLKVPLLLGHPEETPEDRAEAFALITFLAERAGASAASRVTVEIVPVLPAGGAGPAPAALLEDTAGEWTRRLRRDKLKISLLPPHRARVEAALRRAGPRAASALLGVVRAGGRDQGDARAFDPSLWEEVHTLVGENGPRTWSAPATPTEGNSAAEIPAGPSHGFGVPAWLLPGRRPRRAGRGKDLLTADRYRLRYGKGESLRFTSHLDVTRILERAFRRAQLPVAKSRGKEPRPKIAYGPPLPLGMTSDVEVVDVTFSREIPEGILGVLNEVLPEGIRITAQAPIRRDPASLCSAIEIADYEVSFPDSLIRSDLGSPTFDDLKSRLETAVAGALGRTRLDVTKHRGEEPRIINARPSLMEASVVRDDGGRPLLTLRLALNRADSVRPEVLTAALCEGHDIDERLLRVHRSGLYIPGRNELLDPLDVVASGFAWWRQPVRGGTVL